MYASPPPPPPQPKQKQNVFRGMFSGGHACLPGLKHLLNTVINPTWCLAGAYDLANWHVHHYHRGG